jgi:SAM-dependent methyltransferase
VASVRAEEDGPVSPPAGGFFTREVAESFDDYYATNHGARVDALERAAVGELLADVPRGRLLELGCGTGHWTAYFAGQGFDVVATDPAEAMLDVARRRHLAGVTFLLAAGERLPFADSSLPVVAAVAVLEFVDDCAAVVREIGRVLRPDGCFVGGFLSAESSLGDRAVAGAIVRRGRLMTPGEVTGLLTPLGSLETRSCVHLAPDLAILDGAPEASRAAPAFIAVRAGRRTPPRAPNPRGG